MNNYLRGLQNDNNYGITANGAIAHKTSGEKLYDMFSLGGAYRNRSIEDCILLFKNAFEADETYALKCVVGSQFLLNPCGSHLASGLCQKVLAGEGAAWSGISPGTDELLCAHFVQSDDAAEDVADGASATNGA